MTRFDPRPWLVVCVCLAGPAACTAPPSVSPLLRMAEEAMRAESQRLAADVERDVQRIDQTRAALAAAFDADLRQRDALDARWVTDAAEVYAAAREALARHEMALRRERDQRAANLHVAANATRRAVQLIERQDALITRTLGTDTWAWLTAWDPASSAGFVTPDTK